ncbi:MAG: hypothetical protein NXI00_15530 [Cytophagales bacterium]|nr:hypothetical protein [Cytophagales bacterium]
MKETLALIIICLSVLLSNAQEIKNPLKASANLQITNNGVSLFPNLSLGKPAAIINATIAKKNFSFEPEFRWALNGKPWSYIFWLRYRYNTEKFSFRVGAHPAYIFGEQSVIIDGKEENRFVTTRYAAAEISPSLNISEKFKLSVHYLRGTRLDNYGVKTSNFLSLQPSFTNLSVGKEYYINFFPQFFYLQLDNKNGTYLSETITFNKTDFPVYLSNMMTYKIKSTVAGDNFVWSLGLNVKL